MSEISETRVDLFGLPLVPERGKGRPAHEWTEQKSNLVSLLFACERKPIEIARVLGITKPTFYKHYFNEIAEAGFAPLRMRGLQLQRLNAEAAKGNVSAEKALAAMIEREQMAARSTRFGDTKPEKAPKKALGIKEQRREAAWSAGSDDKEWGDLGIGQAPLPN